MNKWERFEAPGEDMKNSPLHVPGRRAHRGGLKAEFPLPNRWGFSLKVVIRQAAKKLPEYHLPVKNDFLPTTVRTQEGEEIEVDTLGRWAFGVPGYQGHLLFEGGTSDSIVIYYPEGTPKELLELLQKAVHML